MNTNPRKHLVDRASEISYHYTEMALESLVLLFLVVTKLAVFLNLNKCLLYVLYLLGKRLRSILSRALDIAMP